VVSQTETGESVFTWLRETEGVGEPVGRVS
jgi:hypothetical protein